MKWTVGVITAPREPSTLDSTLTSLMHARFWFYKSITVFAGPSHPECLQDIPGDVNACIGSDGAYPNFRAAAESLCLISQSDRSHAIMLCEDDIQVTAGLRDHLDSDARFHALLHHPATGVISLYTAAPNHNPAGGWHKVRVPHRAYGALAYVFPPAAARDFLNHASNLDRMNGQDLWVGKWCRDRELNYWCHSPSFVRHTGDVSSLANPGGIPQNRQCAEFLESIP
jgi:hypothetical protein